MRYPTLLEPLVRIELTTSSLPRKCSTTELQRRTCWSGRRGSNSPPIAWKAIALPNELLPLIEQQLYCDQRTCIPKDVGRSGFEPLKSKDSGFTVRPIWPLWNLPLCKYRAEDGTRTRDLLITNQLLYQLSYFGKKRPSPFFGMAKVMESFVQQNFVPIFFHGIQTKKPRR